MQTRMDRVKIHMKENQLDAHLVSATDSIFYLTGLSIHPGERLLVLAITQDSEPTLYVPAMFQVGDVAFKVCYYQDHEKPLESLVQQLSRSNARHIGVDKEWPARFLLEAMRLYPDATWINGSSVVDGPRVTKDALEIDKMKEASRLNDQVMGKVLSRLKEGNISEIEMSEWIQKEFIASGAKGVSFETIVCFGKGSSEPHHECSIDPLVEGPVIIDMGCIVNGYCSDMTRSFYKGKAPQDYRDAYNAVLDANRAAIAAVKPGVALKDIDAAARDLLVARGYGDYFVHRTGHGIGISVHEYPDVSSVSEAVCQVGMIFSIEPGVYLKDAFGIRIEDLVCVTEQGCINLNHFDKELVEF